MTQLGHTSYNLTKHYKGITRWDTLERKNHRMQLWMESYLELRNEVQRSGTVTFGSGFVELDAMLWIYGRN
jgi:hypothetical protein